MIENNEDIIIGFTFCIVTSIMLVGVALGGAEILARLKHADKKGEKNGSKPNRTW